MNAVAIAAWLQNAKEPEGSKFYTPFTAIISIGEMRFAIKFATMLEIFSAVVCCMRTCKPNGGGPSAAMPAFFIFLKNSIRHFGARIPLACVPNLRI